MAADIPSDSLHLRTDVRTNVESFNAGTSSDIAVPQTAGDRIHAVSHLQREGLLSMAPSVTGGTDAVASWVAAPRNSRSLSSLNSRKIRNV